MRTRAVPFVAATVAAWALYSDPTSHADSILLKNGATIRGKARSDDGKVTVDFGQNGKMTFPAADVVKIVADERDEFSEGPTTAPAGARYVKVRLQSSAARFGGGTYQGWELPSADDRVLVLALPGGGEMSILREQIASIEDGEPASGAASAPAPATSADATSIATTHVVTLHNGQKLQGNVIETPESEPLRLAIGKLGITTIRRSTIARVERIDGKIDLPPPPAATPEETTEPPAVDPIEELKAQIREEVLQELLRELIDRKIDEALELSDASLHLRRLAAAVHSDEILDIQFYVRELGRHRNTNRVRAENHLRAYGVYALPFLGPALNHPFELTRRAAMRLIRDAGDVRGAASAIVGLDDADHFVRQHAHEALSAILHTRLPFDPSFPRGKRRAFQERYKEIFRDLRAAALMATNA